MAAQQKIFEGVSAVQISNNNAPYEPKADKTYSSGLDKNDVVINQTSSNPKAETDVQKKQEKEIKNKKTEEHKAATNAIETNRKAQTDKKGNVTISEVKKTVNIVKGKDGQITSTVVDVSKEKLAINAAFEKKVPLKQPVVKTKAPRVKREVKHYVLGIYTGSTWE